MERASTLLVVHAVFITLQLWQVFITVCCTHCSFILSLSSWFVYSRGPGSVVPPVSLVLSAPSFSLLWSSYSLVVDWGREEGLCGPIMSRRTSGESWLVLWLMWKLFLVKAVGFSHLQCMPSMWAFIFFLLLFLLLLSLSFSLLCRLHYCDSAVIGSFLSWVPLVGGSLGALLGGFISDRLVKRRGYGARLWVLIFSQVRIVLVRARSF